MGVRVAFLPNYPLILSLLKYRNVWVFWNKKKSDSNRCSPLNSSIDKIKTKVFFLLQNKTTKKKKPHHMREMRVMRLVLIMVVLN